MPMVKLIMSVPSLSILVAEDNRVNQLYIKTLLGKEGHTVTLAGNGHEVYRLYKSGTYDLVLMDIRMPDMDGLEAASRIRRYEKENHLDLVPIFVISAYDDLKPLSSLPEAEIDLFLTKPLDAEIIRTSILKKFSSSGRKVRVKRRGWNWNSGQDYQKHLLTEYAGDEETLRSMIKMALKEIPVKIDAVKNSIEQKNTSSAMREAHSLANIVSALHRSSECDTAIEIEEKIRRGEWKSASSGITGLRKELDSLSRTLRNLLSGALSK